MGTVSLTKGQILYFAFAGIGNDPRENRKFNMIKQALDYDREGEFVRLWVRELGGLRGGKVHSPWLLSSSQLASAGVELGLTYPRPLLLPQEWSRHAARGDNKREAQKGIDFYFKPVSGQTPPGKKNNKKPLRGGRVQ